MKPFLIIVNYLILEDANFLFVTQIGTSARSGDSVIKNVKIMTVHLSVVAMKGTTLTLTMSAKPS